MTKLTKHRTSNGKGRRARALDVARWMLVVGCFLCSFALRAAVTLTATDALNNSSFNAAGNWSDGQAPHSGTNYVVAVQWLRTPGDANSYTFLGSSLMITNGGGLLYKGSAASQTYTINPLILHNGSLVRSGSGTGNTMILAGTISLPGTNLTAEIRADQSPFIINSAISGSGNLLLSSTSPNTITFNGTNTCVSNTIVTGTVTFGSASAMWFRLGGNGTNNALSGSGSVTLNGKFYFDFSSASTTLGASWTNVTTTTKSYGTTFNIPGFTRIGFGTGPGIWQIATNGTYYSFNTTNSILQVVSSIANPLVPAVIPVAAAPIEADLLASYAASYASSVGGEDNAQVIIANTVAGNNKIQDQSGTGTHMRIAGFYQSAQDVTGQTTTGGIVNWLSGNDSHLSDVVSQGSALGADLVVYICNNSDSSSIAGVSQQPGMYSSLNPSAVWSGVFAHETGGHAYGRSHPDGKLSPKTIMLHNYCGGGAAPPYFYSNEKIWFNGVQLLGDGATACPAAGSSQVNGGDNSTANAQSVADRRTRVAKAPNLNNVVLRWLFTNAPGQISAGTTNYDLVSGAPAIVRGNGAFYTGTTLRIPGGTTGNTDMDSMSAYIDLPNGIVSSRTNVTIEIWATPLSAPNWARIFDFGRTTQGGDVDGTSGEWSGLPGTAAPGSTSSYDDITLTADVGTDITQQRFEAKLAGFATTLDAGLATVAGVPHHYAVTFTDGAGAAGASGGQWQWFRDGDAVAFLDVTNHLADMHDVNCWLGRSMWSGDNNANNDYAEVRISSVAMSRNEILANFLLGPNYMTGATVTMTNSDGSGASSFNAAGQWGNGSSPSSANSYETYDFTLNTPATGSSYIFAGNSLKLSGGSLLWKGTGSSSITVTNLTVYGGIIRNSGSGTFTLAGNLTSSNAAGGTIAAVSGAVNISANLGGNGPLTVLGNNSTTLSGSNTNFTGKLFVGNGMAGVVSIDSQARLGASPTNFVSNQLDLNRGTLKTAATFALNDTNRGILLDISGGTFDVASGTTLTVSSTLSSPAAPSGYTVVAGSLTKASAGTLVLASPTNTFIGTLYVDTGSTTANDGVVKVANNLVLANAHSPIYIENNNSGSSTLQLDGSSGNITLPQKILLTGRSSSVAAIQNIAGTNTISGGLSIDVGGGNYWIQSDGGQLNYGGTLTATASGSRTLTFLGNGNQNITGAITDGSATMSVAKSGAGTLVLAGANTYSGTTTVGAGTLLVNGTSGSGALTISGGTLAGNGTVAGAATVQTGANLSPGSSGIGALTFANGLTLNAGSTNIFEINKTSKTNDVANVTGTVNYAGTLVVANVSGTLTYGDIFKLFNAGGYSGGFTSFVLPTLGTNLVWDTSKLVVDGTLSVSTASQPTVSSAALNGTNFTFSGSGGPALSGYSLLGSTNLTLPLSNWSLLSTGLFDASGSFSVTNSVQPQNPLLFYEIRIP